jgi:hypothetical protein
MHYEIYDDHAIRIMTTPTGGVLRQYVSLYTSELIRDGDNVIATIYDHTGAVAVEYTEPIVFDALGVQTLVMPDNGIATLALEPHSEDYKIKTANEKMANGELLIRTNS